MRENTRLRGRAALAAGTALSLGVLGALVGGAAATAAQIDTSRQGTIIVHKYANPGNGDQRPDGGGTGPNTAPIAGVVFEYCAIAGIDLLGGDNAGWDAINNITPAEKTASARQGVTTLGSHTLTNCTALPATAADGSASSGSLPLGAYFVREVSAPSNVVALAAPFIVTLPTPKNHKVADGEWQYDVNVYPKNTIASGPQKNVVDQATNGAVLGSTVTYQVTQLVPALATGETYDKLIMTDDLDDRLAPSVSVPVKVKASATLVEGPDYTATWAGQKLTVTFTAAGLAKLKAGENVVYEFQATVTKLDTATGTDGDIKNTAYVNLNDFEMTPGKPNGPDGSPTDEFSTRWGDLLAQKVSAANTAQGLAGAVFRIHMSMTDVAGQCRNDLTGLTLVNDPATGNPLEITADANGDVEYSGLWIGDTQKTVAADGTVSNTTVPGHDLQQRCYVLEEVKAPAGYVLPSGAAALTPVMVKTGVNGPAPLVTIENVQQGAPELPFTGSSAQLALTIGGIALLVVALGGVLLVRFRNSRRDSA
ncbi:SpaH/EbpB family LPXTG-anchored major pilin [Leifsonia sp. NPDC077715]|uniref:SpaH/EbpB family LPXTG-anchored major pilin n=1 Tax=Leifsonia sp. NPDC077715 TaxID=3155539 RepID=UPI003432F8E6